MVEKFQEIVKELIVKHGSILIFAVMRMDDLVDKWSVIISAPWIGPEDTRKVFDEVLFLMKARLDKEELDSMARIGVYNWNEHLIEQLLSFRSGAVIDDQKINGNVIYKGYIIESNSELLKEKIKA